MAIAHPEWIITADELKSNLNHLTLVDVREPSEHATSHIPGCKLIPLGEIELRASELNLNDDIVLYCARGVRSMHALMALKRLGFQKLRSLDGGIYAWEEKTKNSV